MWIDTAITFSSKTSTSIYLFKTKFLPAIWNSKWFGPKTSNKLLSRDERNANSLKANMRSSDHLCLSSAQFRVSDCFGSCRYRVNHENSSFAQLPWENEKIPWKNKRWSQSARSKLLIIVMVLDWLINSSLTLSYRPVPSEEDSSPIK